MNATLTTFLTAMALLALAGSPVTATDAFEALQKSMERLECEISESSCAAANADRAQREATARARYAQQAAAAEQLGREPKKIWIGDSAEYVELQWGKPESVDRMVTANGVTEWWWYAANAVHFVDGRVESVHTER